MEDQDIKHAQINEDEINLIEVTQIIWRNRKFIIKVTAVFAILGFIFAISTPNVYTASCTLVPQTGEKKTGGSLSGLAAMAGINLSSLSSGEVLSPTVYPRILSNINFQKELIYSKYHFEEIKDQVTFYDYFTNEKYNKLNFVGIVKKYTVGLPGVILKSIRRKTALKQNSNETTIILLTEDEKEVLKILDKNISLDVNSKDGYVSISVNMPEPLLAAELAQRAQELLQKYITEFKIEKVTQNLEFVERNYEEGKMNFESKQAELARFRDANKSFSSAVAKTQEEKLSSEYNLLLGIYTELAKQKEQAKIAVTETTPILTIIEPVLFPNEKSKPNRAMIMVLFIIMGLSIGIGIVLTVMNMKEYLNSKIKNSRFLSKIN